MKKLHNFIISDHARERFIERFPELLPRFSNNVESAITHELNFSKTNNTLNQDRFKGHRIKQLMRHNYEISEYRTSKKVVFVIANNTIKTVYPRKGSVFDPR